MKINAFAKINLTLDIGCRRPDGYHDISSVMIPISLCDTVTVEKSKAPAFSCNDKTLADDGNLCVRAAKAFLGRAGIDESVSISLEKNIPVAAGLGGGSADAAAVLTALNTIYDEALDRNALFELASEIGSDVPFCLLGACALCRGRGEILTPIMGTEKLFVTVAIGRQRLSTAEVYKEFDKANLHPTGFTEQLLATLPLGRKAAVKSFGNGFAPICAALCPETETIRSLLVSAGAENALVSGSGASVFGVFPDRETADAAAEKLEKSGFFAVSCTTL